MRRPFSQGDLVVLTPTRFGKRGEAEAEFEGWCVRIPGAIPGEAARVRIVHISRGGPVAAGKLVEPIGADPARRAPPCPIHDRCGGCGMQHLEEHAALAHKIARARELLPDTEWREPIRAPRGFHYRAKTFLLPQRRGLELILGARPPRGPFLVDTSGCGVLLPHLEALAARLRAQLADRADLDGAWRSLLLRANRAGQTQATIVHKSHAGLAPIEADAVFAQVHDRESNVICSDEEERRLSGAPITERFGDVEIEIPPTAFWQANPDVAEQLYELAADALEGECLGELYCGAGAAGLLALKRRPGASLLGVDRAPRAIAAARANARRNDLDAEFVVGRAEETAHKWDAVLVNPPRGGCHEGVLEAIRGAARVVYLSCNPATLARDVARLGFRLEWIRPADMLPQTPHLELLALLTRR